MLNNNQNHIITDIRPQRRKGRINIELDGAFWTGVNEMIAHELKLVVGRSLSETEKQEIENEVVYMEALNYCLNLLGQRNYPSPALKDKMTLRGWADNIQDSVLVRLEELELVNDQQFSIDFVLDRVSRGWGNARIERDLKQRKLSAPFIEKALESIQDDDFSRAERALGEKFKSSIPMHQRDKATRWLIQRGFDFAISKQVVESKLTQMDEVELSDALKILMKLKDKDRQKGWSKLRSRGHRSEIISQALRIWLED